MSDFAAQWMFGDQQSASADLIGMAQAAKMPEPTAEQKLARFRARGGLERSRGARIVEGAGSGGPISSSELGLPDDGPKKLARAPMPDPVVEPEPEPEPVAEAPAPTVARRLANRPPAEIPSVSSESSAASIARAAAETSTVARAEPTPAGRRRAAPVGPEPTADATPSAEPAIARRRPNRHRRRRSRRTPAASSPTSPATAAASPAPATVARSPLDPPPPPVLETSAPPSGPVKIARKAAPAEPVRPVVRRVARSTEPPIIPVEPAPPEVVAEPVPEPVAAAPEPTPKKGLFRRMLDAFQPGPPDEPKALPPGSSSSESPAPVAASSPTIAEAAVDPSASERPTLSRATSDGAASPTVARSAESGRAR